MIMDNFGAVCDLIDDFKEKLKSRQNRKKLLRGQNVSIFFFHFITFYLARDKKREILIEFFFATLRQSHKFMQQKQTFRESLSGLNHLHSTLNIVHGGLKPENILVVDSNGSIKLNIFFSQKKKNSKDNHHELLKSALWIAPEYFEEKYEDKSTKAADMFSLGLVFYYLLTNYSNPLELISNFKFDKFHLEIKINLEPLDQITLKNTTTDIIFAVQLVKEMVQRKQNERLSISESLKQPYFWSNWQYIQFVKALVADISEFDLEDQINEYTNEIIGDDWSKSLDFIRAPFYAANNIMGCIHSISKIYQKYDNKISNCLDITNRVMEKFPRLIPLLYDVHKKFIYNMNPQRETSKKVSFKHFPDKKIGAGVGTSVYKGMFEKQTIAIKRVSKKHTEQIRKEMNMFLKIRPHPNIVLYFGTQHDASFSYIGLELCDCTLEQLIFDPQFKSLKERFPNKEIMLQVTEGLKELHKLAIVHRDIKPTNIMVVKEEMKVKISDYGITATTRMSGTHYWMAPEKIKFEPSDIYSLGCVFFFVYFKSSFRFENKLHTEKNILEVFKCLKKQKKSNEDLLAIHLMQKMLHFETSQRATAPEILRHAFFWHSSRWIGFLLEIGNKLEKNVIDQTLMRRNSIDPTLKLLQDKIDKGSFLVVGKDWKFKLDQLLVDNLEPWRNKKVYDGTKLSELIRAFRNKWTDKEKLNTQVKALFGKFTEIYFLNYFTKRFPPLLMHMHEVVESNAKDLFPEYFSQNFSIDVTNIIIHNQTNGNGNGHSKYESKNLTLSFEQKLDFTRFKNTYESLVLFGLNSSLLEREDKLSSFLLSHCKMVKRLIFKESKLDVLTVVKICKKLPRLEILSFEESRNIHENDILPKTYHREFEFLKHLKLCDSDFFDVFNIKDDFISIQNIRQSHQDQKLMNLISQQTALQELRIHGNLERFYLKLYQVNFQLRDLTLNHDVKGSIPKRNIANFLKTQFKLEQVHLCLAGEQIIGDFNCFADLYNHILQKNPIKDINFQLDCCMLKYLWNATINCESLETLWCRVFNGPSLNNSNICAKCSESGNNTTVDCERNFNVILKNFGLMFPNLNQITFHDEDQSFSAKDHETRSKRNTIQPFNDARQLKFFRYRIEDIRNFNWLSRMKVHTMEYCEITFITNAINDPIEKINLKDFEEFALHIPDLKELTIILGHFVSDITSQRKFLQTLLKIILKTFKRLENLNIDSEQRNLHQSYSKNMNKVPDYLKEVFGDLSKLRTLKNWKIIGFSKN